MWNVSNEPAEIEHTGEEIFTKGIDFNDGSGGHAWGHRIEVHADSAEEAEELALKITTFLNETK